MRAIDIIRQRLLGLGGDFAALANSKNDAELTKQVLGDPSLFTGDPIRDQLAAEAGGATGTTGGTGGITSGGGQLAASPLGNFSYPGVNLPPIYGEGGAQMGTPTLDWLRFLEARRQYDVSTAMQLQGQLQNLAANPRDWIQNWMARGSNEPLQTPPWLQQMTGQGPTAGQAGQVPYPWQLSLPQYARLRPSEQQGLQGFYSALGFSPEDLNASVTGTAPLASSMPGGGVFNWRLP